MQRLITAAVIVATGAAAGDAHAQPAPDPGGPAPDPDPAASSAAPDPGSAPPATPPSAPAPAAPPALPAPSDLAPVPAADDDIGDQAIAAGLGLATGGRVTPGGVQVTGHYLYQLSARDWFDGAASFTFGGSQAECFRDRQDMRICSHGLADGFGVELAGAVRRLFPAQGQFRPFARVGAGIGLARFSGDDVTGVTFRLHGGGGVRVAVAPSLAVVADGDLQLGFGSFGSGLGSEPQLGLVITAGAEFRLR